MSKVNDLIRLLEDVRYRNKYRKSTDKYKSELQKTYEEWYEDFAIDLSKEKGEAKRRRLTDAALLVLLMELKRLGRERLEEAYMQSIEAVDITPEMVDEMELIIASNDDYLADSLMPALGERIEKNVTPEIWFAGLAAIQGTFAGFTARVGLYAGAYWNAIWKGAAQQQVVQGRAEWAILWLKDPRARHCSSCLEFAGAYVNYDTMLVVTGGVEPGLGTECDGNCRCTMLTRPGPGVDWVVMGSGGVSESMREKGVGRGWWGPPKGTHGPGSLGGGESGTEIFDNLKTATKMASFDGLKGELPNWDGYVASSLSASGQTFQEAAREEFGGTWVHRGRDRVEYDDVSTMRPKIRALKAHTDAALHDIDSVRLYRGMAINPDVNLSKPLLGRQNPVSSWTHDLRVAKMFADTAAAGTSDRAVIFSSNVPISQILTNGMLVDEPAMELAREWLVLGDTTVEVFE